ncbi:MAG: exopolyphosphatase [Actinomycetota bacterium]|nr:exopolyphosphatase [Actinomycetota bacterium]
MTRVAAYDCGTNSLRLLVADLDEHGFRIDELEREMRIVRLGEGVDSAGRITDAAMGRVFAAVEELMALAGRHDVTRTRFCATSAARDADNAADFLAGVRDRIGVEPEVLDGDEEARLSFAGATRSLAADLAEPYLVIDIGGGSTELILGDAESGVRQAESLDIGSVRLTERHLHQDPATGDELLAAARDIDAALDDCHVDLSRAGGVVGVAGTVTTIAAGALGLEAYDRARIHHSVLDIAAVQETVAALLAMSVEQRRSLGYMHPGRADVIGAGGLILDRVLRRTPVADVLVSEHDILDAIAWSLA